MSIDESNLCTGIVDVENIESLVLCDGLFDLVGLEAFACAALFDFRHFKSASTARWNHLANDVIDAIDDTLDLALAIFNAQSQRVL